jgi:hypothetical protein
MAAPVATPQLRISLARARAHWHARAGLARALSGDPDDVIGRTGWVRTLGGVDVYLAVRARAPGLARAALDALVEQARLRVIPAVRGCIYLVPAAHVPLALRVAEDAWRPRAARDLERAGSSWGEVDDVARGVTEVLARGPLTTDAIRRTLPAGAVRSLGDRGKQVGLSSPLPVALRALEVRNAIERTLAGGRLDTERYVWRAAGIDAGWTPTVPVPADAVGRWAELARIFVGFAGPATVADLAAWAGLAARDARAAVTRAGLAPIAIDGYAADAWVAPDDVAALSRPAGPSDAVALLSFEDNYLVAHGGPRWVVDPEHWARPVQVWGSTRGSTLGDAGHIQTRTVVVGDRVVGFWELDPDAGQVRWAPLGTVAASAREVVDRLAGETATFLVEQLGHARSFSLDTDDDVRRRAAEVAAMAVPAGQPAGKAPAANTLATKQPARNKPAAAAKPAAPKAPARRERTAAAKPAAATTPARTKPAAAANKPRASARLRGPG